MAEERVTLRAGIRSLPGPVWILCAGSFVNRFGSFVAVFLVLYLREMERRRVLALLRSARRPVSRAVARRL